MKKIACFLMCVPSLAFAQAIPGGHSFDNKQPIEITSDSLEVHQEENTATFIGSVVAIQGDVRLKSDRMIVYYTGSADKKAAPKPAKTEGSAQKQSIKKIDVEGNVLLTTPEETASGARGDYDVINQEIHLNDDVLLTRGQNTLKGNHLTYNFEKGQSVITGGPVAGAGASAGHERVRALFVPDKKPDAAKKTP